jgi:AcrR family transcriptional regulator
MPNTKIDRRIIRSKLLLRNALRQLMSQKKFRYITVQEISDISTINRATFYKHYFDKHALLSDVFQEDFQRLLEERTKETKTVDKEFLRHIIIAVSDFLMPIRKRHMQDHPSIVPLEQKTVQQMIANRLFSAMEASKKKNGDQLKAKVKAAMAGWAIYAAVNQWIELSLEKKLKQKDSTIESFSENILDPITGLIK